MERKDIRLALVFKDFAVWLRDASCVGLNVAGYATAKVLNQHGIETTVFPVRHNVDVVQAIERYNKTHNKPLTHVVISAPWLSLHDLKSLIEHFKEIKFVVLSHSNVGFLQADPWGVELLRKYAKLSHTHHNLKIGGNSRRFVEWISAAYCEDAVLLPNLYPADDPKTKKPWNGYSTIKIGAFGAVRPEKNFMTAAAAAVLIQAITHVPVELHMSSGGEGDKCRTSQAVDQMCLGNVTIIRHPWCYWDKFVEIVSEMDLLLQVSYTESFNMITADGISVGVPSVVSTAIHWAPDEWKADSDDAVNVADVGINLLLNTEARSEGIEYLRAHNEDSLDKWEHYLLECENHWYSGIFDFLGF